MEARRISHARITYHNIIAAEVPTLKFLKSHRGGIGAHHRRNAASAGLWPSVFNLATKAVIFANATCGQDGREEFCRMAEGGKGRCGVCDEASPDEGKRHPIEFAIDDTNRWWQSPALYYGPEYEFVTITIDLKQVYQIAYVIVKMANSPRPGTWILERSVDGKNFSPWQFFARSDKECFEKFGIEATKGKPQYFTDTEVICTSYYSRMTPLENGEIHTSLIHGRPGANETSPELLEFTKARYVRLSLMGLRGTQEPLPRWLLQDVWKDKKLFYAIRDISVGGQCVCNGHAENCRHNVASGDHTTGINCDKCEPGFFRPEGTLPDAAQPCIRCNCGPADSCIQYGPEAGTCRCRLGFIGDRCDSCAPGFRGYPDCEPCPCDARGVAGLEDCEGECLCKTNVEGKYCDRCKPGHFGLRNDVPEGCLSCFCSGVTTLCEPAAFIPRKIQSLKEWQITDLKVSKVVKPNWNGQSVFSLGNYDFPGITSLYWFAPQDYLGNKLEAYNSNFLIKVQWVVMRGDTSGVPTRGPNIVIGGTNGLKIAHGDDSHTSSNTDFHIKLSEPDWFHIPEDIKDITEIDPSVYHGGKVSRSEFLSVLADVKYILLRSTFHTDQIEALLEEATLNLGEEEDIYSSVEKCSCPSGYTGLSCESCSFGYVRIYTNTSLTSTTLPTDAFCAKCDCNGHSPTCNATTGECFCEHNTLGRKCERCSPGFYGNPTRGTPEDCKKCACPLLNDENNFSPSCQLDYFTEELDAEGTYVCTQCPKGYTGDHCEICDDGFYGNPMEIGNNCQLCDCNGGPCDRTTGQCLSCKGNTEGWKCEKCKPEHYGEPSLSNCKACECDPIGSITKQCDNNTGQCHCKDKFTGRTCDKCEIGYGNVTALCTPCSCNSMGSKSEVCDTHTGTCDCQPGVEGFHCDACQNLYYGFSEAGCQPCTCDPDGSKFPMCDVKTGECVCSPHYTGKSCAVCENGYWKQSKTCVECKCNEHGSLGDTYCDKETGQCQCKTGVMGNLCDLCLPGHYGNVKIGCKKCDPCDKKGHICDPTNGKCVCPPLTTGSLCERCSPNAWGYEPAIGCKACACSATGSSDLQCDLTKGTCSCQDGFEGEKCDRCSYGYYGYPNCRKCGCDPTGTEEGQCQNGLCRCADDGTCLCKQNVQGKNCNTCKENKYGLRKGNPQGCTECFCFGRSNQCEDALYHWSKTTRLERNIEESNQVAEDELMLPTTFMGDITSSYGGYLVVEVPGGYFDVFLEGNSVELHSESNNNELQLVESENWRVVSRNTDFPSSCVHRLTRACFMVVLQKVTAFVVKSNNRIKEVLLDKAKNEESTYPITHSIEKCQCPEEYTGLSCQDPNEGFYRYYPRDQQSSWVDVVVGIAKECDCEGHSSECDAETGFCENCDEHTSGNHCETCIEGFYMDKYRNCAPCLCPSADQNNAKSCFPKGDHFKCECKEGYTGNFCEECDERFYRKPNSTSCEPCNCNRFGIVPGDPGNCNQFGRCTCGQGFTGAKCDQCIEKRKYIKNGICETCDECTMKLFDVIDLLKHDIEGLFEIFKNGIGPPWKKLTENVEKLKKFSARYYQKKEKLDLLTENADKEDNEAKVTKIKEKLSKNSILAEENLGKTDKIYEKSGRLLEESMELSGKLITLIQSLESFGTKHVNLKEALKRARYTLKEIEGVSKQFTTYQDEALSFCAKVSKTVDNLYKLPPELPEKQLVDLKGRIQDLIDIGTHVENISKIADIKNLENSKGLEKVKEKVEILKSKNKNIEIALGNIMKNNVAIGEAKDNLHIVYGELGKIQDFVEFKEIEDRVKKQMKDIPEIGLLHSRAIEHVQRLDEKINKYNSLFNFTKDEWKKINASGAYEAIVSGVQEAEASVKVSRDILSDAIGLIEPEKMDSLGVRTNLAHAYSDRLKQRINNLKNISKNFGEIQNKLVKLKYGILENGKSNNDLTQILHKINNEITSQSERVASLEEAMKNATVVSEDMRNIEKQLDDMSFDKQFVLTKKYQKYSELTAPEGKGFSQA
nr:laminin subunit alpha-2-like [Leptinotarsa decemlineata]